MLKARLAGVVQTGGGHCRAKEGYYFAVDAKTEQGKQDIVAKGGNEVGGCIHCLELMFL